MSCIQIFNLTTHGDNNPKGSKILAMSDKTWRLVNNEVGQISGIFGLSSGRCMAFRARLTSFDDSGWLSRCVTLEANVSEIGIHKRPNVFIV